MPNTRTMMTRRLQSVDVVIVITKKQSCHLPNYRLKDEPYVIRVNGWESPQVVQGPFSIVLGKS